MFILITGTSRGLGKYFSEALLKEGHKVYGCSSSGKHSIDHENYSHFKADVRSEHDVKSMLKEIRKSSGHLDCLINNAGIASMNHFITTPLSTAQRVMDINFIGTFLVSREAAKIMRKSNNGRIINFSTVASPLNLEGEAIYASSKAAIEKFTKVLAKELSSFNITVNAVGPTPINTKLIAGVPKEKIDDLLLKQSIKRMGTEQDVYNIIKFFLNPDSDFVTGQIIYLGGVF